MALEDKAGELLDALHQSQTPTVAKVPVESGKPLQNTSGHSQDWYIPVEGEAELTVKILNAAKEAIATPYEKVKLLKQASLVTVRIPPGCWIEVTFTKTIGEATTVTGA